MHIAEQVCSFNDLQRSVDGDDSGSHRPELGSELPAGLWLWRRLRVRETNIQLYPNHPNCSESVGFRIRIIRAVYKTAGFGGNLRR